MTLAEIKAAIALKTVKVEQLKQELATTENEIEQLRELEKKQLDRAFKEKIRQAAELLAEARDLVETDNETVIKCVNYQLERLPEIKALETKLLDTLKQQLEVFTKLNNNLPECEQLENRKTLLAAVVDKPLEPVTEQLETSPVVETELIGVSPVVEPVTEPLEVSPVVEPELIEVYSQVSGIVRIPRKLMIRPVDYSYFLVGNTTFSGSFTVEVDGVVKQEIRVYQGSMIYVYDGQEIAENQLIAKLKLEPVTEQLEVSPVVQTELIEVIEPEKTTKPRRATLKELKDIPIAVLGLNQKIIDILENYEKKIGKQQFNSVADLIRKIIFPSFHQTDRLNKIFGHYKTTRSAVQEINQKLFTCLNLKVNALREITKHPSAPLAA